jgi:alpha-tubulin suppressor-like RCC1 family protein
LGGQDFVLKGDGRPFAWGKYEYSRDHQMFIPAGLSNVVALCKNTFGDGVALRSDGTVAQWSFNGQMGVDPRPLEEINGEVIRWVERLVDFHIIEGLSNVISIAAGDGHGLALERNGTVFGWGYNNVGQATGTQATNFPVNWGRYVNDNGSSQGLVTIGGKILTNIVAIAAEGYVSIALKSDGTVVTWGFSPGNAQKVPDGLSNVVAIANGCLAITTNRAVAEKFRQK